MQTLLRWTVGLFTDGVANLWRIVWVGYFTTCGSLIILLGCGISSYRHDWTYLERYASLTVVVGLILLTRRYIRMGVREAFISETVISGGSFTPTDAERRAAAEILEDIKAAKMGFIMSLIGTVIWGWGSIITWWSLAIMLLLPLQWLSDRIIDQRTARP